MTERFYVVNNLDEPILILSGKDEVHDGPHGKPYFHRAAHVIVELYGGRMIIQKKGPTTENAGKWSSAASGHVRAEESYQAAAKRELFEELGINAPIEELVEVGIIEACEKTSNEFVHVFSYLMDPDKESLRPDPDEVDAAAIISTNALFEDVYRNPTKYSEPFIIALNMFMNMGGQL